MGQCSGRTPALQSSLIRKKSKVFEEVVGMEWFRKGLISNDMGEIT